MILTHEPDPAWVKVGQMQRSLYSPKDSSLSDALTGEGALGYELADVFA